MGPVSALTDLSPVAIICALLYVAVYVASAFAGPIAYLHFVRALKKGLEPGDGDGDAGSSVRSVRPADVHPVLQDALSRPSSLGPDDSSSGMLGWFVACALHAAATDGSVRVRWTGKGAAPMGRDGEPLPADSGIMHMHTRDHPLSDYEPLYKRIVIERTGRPKDPIDALLIRLFLSSEGSDPVMPKPLDEEAMASMTPEEREKYEECIESVKFSTGTRRASVSLNDLLYLINRQWDRLTDRFSMTRIMLSDLAAKRGLCRDMDLQRLGFLRGWALALAILAAMLVPLIVSRVVLMPLTFALVVNQALSATDVVFLPDGFPLGTMVLAIALAVWARVQLPKTSETLTDRGRAAAEAMESTLRRFTQGEMASDAARMDEGEQLRLACYLVMRGPSSPETLEFASHVGSSAAEGTWQRAFFLLCGAVPVETHGKGFKRSAPGVRYSNALALCANDFGYIDADKRD